jgi:hypothetical protein
MFCVGVQADCRRIECYLYILAEISLLIRFPVILFPDSQRFMLRVQSVDLTLT